MEFPMTPDQRPQSLEDYAAGTIDAVDMRLLEGLAAFYTEVDPVPAGLVDRLQFSLTLDALHAEIAELQRVPHDALATRGEDFSQAQTVTFTSQSLTTMVTISPSGSDRVRIDGWVAPGGGVHVELRLVDGELTTVADADGRFVFDEVPRGLAQFVLRAPSVPEKASGPAAEPAAVITPCIQL
jgi:hypothetical protein